MYIDDEQVAHKVVESNMVGIGKKVLNFNLKRFNRHQNLCEHK